MNVCIVGLGHVGIVNAAYLIRRGHHVTGLDVSQERINRLRTGMWIPEPGVDDTLRAALKNGRLRLGTAYCEALAGARVAIICVPTPRCAGAGRPDLQFLHQAATSVSRAAVGKAFDVVLRSTVPPGTTRTLMSGVLANIGCVWYYPEFMREGNALEDMHHPPIRIIGAPGGASPRWAKSLYGETGQVTVTDYETAEIVKYVCNAFHALKIAFTNEVSSICKALGIDSNTVMDVVCSDRKLNISRAYMKPGFAFGGSCLPKDLAALVNLSDFQELASPLLRSILASNDCHIAFALQKIAALALRGPIGMLGISFKPHTGDVRDSPFLRLGNKLISAGYQVIAYDPAVESDPFESEPLLSQREGDRIGRGRLVHSMGSLRDCSLLLIAHSVTTFNPSILPILKGKRILDLCNDPARDQIAAVAEYESFCWGSRVSTPAVSSFVAGRT